MDQHLELDVRYAPPPRRLLCDYKSFKRKHMMDMPFPMKMFWTVNQGEQLKLTGPASHLNE